MCSDFIKKQKKHVKVRAEIIKKNQRTIYVINNVYKLSIAKQNKQKHVIRIMPVNTFLLPIDRYHFSKWSGIRPSIYRSISVFHFNLKFLFDIKR